MNAYLLALGANLGDREYYIAQAIDAIRRKCGPILAVAPILETPPWGGTADQAFLNTALICQSSLDPHTLLQHILAIESSLGRVRMNRWGNRTLDCDMILWQTASGEYPLISSLDLTIPHPEAAKRAFVLEPAAAIAGDWIHPIEKRSLRQLWIDFSQK